MQPMYAICNVPIAPIRKEPKHSAEQSSQLLFGEKVEILQLNETTEWVQIRCEWDTYKGYCKLGQLSNISTRDFRKTNRITSNTQQGSLHIGKAVTWIPMGSELQYLKKSLPNFEPSSLRFKGKKLDLKDHVALAEGIIHTASTFLFAPYQWGGRSFAGIDCSGLVQIAFKQQGIRLLRDACDQATMGEEVHFLQETKPGDLAFFDNADGKIIHVGIISERDKIIHATDTSGRVVVDRIDNAGIISVSLRKRTHNLRMIRRIIL